MIAGGVICIFSEAKWNFPSGISAYGVTKYVEQTYHQFSFHYKPRTRLDWIGLGWIVMCNTIPEQLGLGRPQEKLSNGRFFGEKSHATYNLANDGPVNVYGLMQKHQCLGSYASQTI